MTVLAISQNSYLFSCLLPLASCLLPLAKTQARLCLLSKSSQ
ncbi:hypothetical protein [Moorena sp. SIO4G3]|nr:hypothetical protein [Moorena sp. SIO4G3]